MKSLGIKYLNKRNIYNHRKVAKLTVDIGRFSDIPTNEIKGFNEKLIENFPGLKLHTCSLGYEGGFVERLKRGTYLAHVLEHLVIDMQNMLGYHVKYGKTLSEEGDVFDVLVEFENKDVVERCLKYAIRILNAFVYNDRIDIKKMIDNLFELKSETDLGLSTEAIVKEAEKLGIPTTRIGDQNLVRLNYGNKARLVQATLLDSTSCIAADIASDKNLTKQILHDMQIPVPEGYVVSNPNDAFDAAVYIDAPVVIKPLNSNQGKGVRTNLYSQYEITSSFDVASSFSKKVIVERHISGDDYRVLVVGNKVSAVAKRTPAKVVGDGYKTIEELVEEENKNPNRGNGHEKPLTKIKISSKTDEVLSKQGYSLYDVPKAGEEVFLFENCNLSTGGTSEDFTDKIHPENARLAIKSAKVLGIDVAGVDFVVQDISKPISKDNEGAIIEVNACPGIRMHLHPLIGKPRSVAKDIINHIYPNKKEINFPIISVTGTNGKTTTVRLISHVLVNMGKIVGRTDSDGTFIDNKCVFEGDNSGAESARQLLTNNEIEVAVLETARGGIIKKGLGYDLADVGIVTNIAEDHLGLNNINTLEDLAHVKSLVVEALKPNGYAVLNAEDENTKYIASKVYENIIYFYLNKKNVVVDDLSSHIFVTLKDNYIVVIDGKKETKIVSVEKLPITLNGLIECNIINCLTAVAALHALKIPVRKIKQGLESFVDNSGRFELFEFENFRVLLDYAHNYDSVKQLIEVSKKLKHSRLVGVIGMPGDRSEEDYKRVAKICSDNFNVIYVKEDEDLRDRKKGDVEKIFANEIIASGFNKDNLAIISSEKEALKTAIEKRQKGDLIVCTYEKLKPMLKIVNSYNEE